MNTEIFYGSKPPEKTDATCIRFTEIAGGGIVEIYPRHADLIAVGVGESLVLDGERLKLPGTILFTKQTKEDKTRVTIIAPDA